MQNPYTYNHINDTNKATNPSKVCETDSFDTLQKARHDLVGELDAIIQYDDHIHSSTHPEAVATWESIRNEELTHVGELLSLILYLCPEQKNFIDSGMKEFNERLQIK